MTIFERFDLKTANMSSMLTRLGIESAVFAQECFGSLFTASIQREFPFSGDSPRRLKNKCTALYGWQCVVGLECVPTAIKF